MYGMVNKAVVDMVSAHFGADTWEAIRIKAGLDEDLFLSMRQYPDDVTYRLVDASSEVLKIPPEQVLEAFGRYWVAYTAREGYGELLKLSGRTLWDFLANLDNLHSRVGLSFTDLKPPSFRCSGQTPTSLKLHYRSHRKGLSHLVVGLLKGVGELFKTPVEVSLLSRSSESASEDVFLVSLTGRAS